MGQKDCCLEMEVERIIAGEGGRRTMLSGDRGQKDSYFVMEVGRTIVARSKDYRW